MPFLVSVGFMDFVTRLFDVSGFPARWHCGRWSAGHGWLHILSDVGIWSAYFAIPAILLYFLKIKPGVPFRKIFLLFGAFILFCGLTHLMEAIIFWWPAYRLAGVLKLMTALVSWTTVLSLIRIGPRVMQMRTTEELEREVAARRKAEEALQLANSELEERVRDRTSELETANSTLQVEREWFRTTLASIGDGVITTDLQGRVTMLNEVAEELTGWSQAEAEGRPLPEIFRIVNEETREAVDNPALRALRTGIIVGLANHTVLIDRDGTERYIDDSASPIKDSAGLTIGAVLIFRDISEQYRVDRERRELAARLATLVQNAPAAIALFDHENRFVDINERGAEINGFPREAHLGRRISDVLTDLGTDVERYLNRVRETGEPQINIEIGGRTDGMPGETQYWLASYYPVRDERGRWLGVGAVAQEITDRKRNEQTLRYQYDLTKAITDNATTAIFMMDNESRCTFMNPAAERMTGFSFAEAEGRLLHELIHHTRADGTYFPISECPIDRALPEGFDVHDHEDLFFRKNGERFPVVCNARPIYQNGKGVGTVIEVLDVTQQKQAAEKLTQSERRFLQLADAIPQLAWIAEGDGYINWYNNRWYQYTGKTLREMEGWGWQSVHDPEILPQVVETWKRSLATGDPFDMVFPIRGADGVFRPFLTRVMPFRDENGTIIHWFGTNTDISEQQRTQEELRTLAARLSDEDRRKDEFLATLAHELRNPLAPIRTGLEVMKMVKDDPVVLEEIRGTMERQTQQLITLVDDLLDVSRITQGKLELRKCRVRLSDVVRSAVEAARPSVDEAGHELTVRLPEDPIELDADPHRLAQVLSNLLNNAVKYTPEGGRIDLIAESDGANAVLTVRDTGIGIPPEMVNHIFEMFAQIERPMERGYTGLGIGLTLVKSLVTMHGGSVEVSSDARRPGSEFRVRIPIRHDLMETSPKLDGPTEGRSTKSSGRRRVLIVDDNTAAAEMLSLVVKILGNEVATAGDGMEAIRLAAEFLPDVVLMDLGMPRMNGYETARHFRQQAWGERIMLVALTGWGQDEDRQRTKEAGFDYHLVKPAEPAALQALFEQIEVTPRPSL